MRECSSDTMCHVACVMSHVSCVTCHVSPVTCHVSPVTCQKKLQLLIFFLKKSLSGGASRGRVCYQRGVPRLVYAISITFFAPSNLNFLHLAILINPPLRIYIACYLPNLYLPSPCCRSEIYCCNQ